MTQFIMSVTHQMYYREQDRLYRIYEGAHWVEITQEQLTKDLLICKETGEKYMIVYDYVIMNKRDHWDAAPQKIDRNELDFWHLYGLLNESDYLHFINLIAS
ncbi:hypothetical protein [Paenibacillus abyssi]|uniref:Uncharacterized protein n=1 Tax=Paenibacillus abyssi TaxID=1340531 RepID=A0A917G1Y6_9BACL|nr:hypothetical protein [Paenibacillus abyssi]GGG17744.1 hypothetical protein GCM10010916_38220 [Paenibacillus abyssi]